MYNQGYHPQQPGGGAGPVNGYQPGAYGAGGYQAGGVPPTAQGAPVQYPTGAYNGSANAWYAPAPGQQAPVAQQPRRRSSGSSGGGRGGNGGRKNKLNPKSILALIAIVAIVVGVGVVLGSASQEKHEVQQQVNQYANVFLPQVFVDGIDLSGMTYEEGKAVVEAHLEDKKNGWYIRLSNGNGDSNTITAHDLGISWDPTAALTAAWSVGRSNGNLTEQNAAIQQALNEGVHHFSSAQQDADTTPIDTILSTLERAAYLAPQDAEYLGFDPDNTDNPFQFKQEVWGRRLDTTAVKAQILQLVENLECGEIMLNTELVAPQVTVDQLSVNYELRCRAITPISSASSEDRTDNIRIAFSKVNGTMVRDGYKFSFNSIVGKRSLANGFHAAVEYVNGLEAMGIGGGVCQASTTVYLAAVQSGMKITKRVPHSMAVSYTELGKDATVTDTKGHEIDFTFQNNSGAPIYITAHVISSPTNKKNLYCEVRIYGKAMEGIRYELIAETTEVIPKPEDPIIVKDKNADYVTYTDQKKTVAKGRDGYVVNSYLITYQDNVETGRKHLYTDNYPAKADTVYVGVTQR